MFHMFQLNVSSVMMICECLMLMLMLCKSSYARLTPEVLHFSTSTRVSRRTFISSTSTRVSHHCNASQQGQRLCTATHHSFAPNCELCTALCHCSAPKLCIAKLGVAKLQSLVKRYVQMQIVEWEHFLSFITYNFER